MRLALVVVAGLLSACTTPTSNDVAATAAADGKICKRVTTVSSNVPQRDCRTPEEWAAAERQDQANVDEFERARDVTATGQ